jgi:DNA-directed RNA polymerase specialized sigma24 family protein
VPFSAPASSGPGDGLPEREVEIVKHVVRDFLSTRVRHPDLEPEDLLQECLFHWWSQRPRYTQSRGAPIENFLRRVVKAKLLDLERGIKAQKRGQGHGPASLDRPLAEDEPQGDTLGDTIADSADTEWSAMYRVSLGVVLARLNPQQKQLMAGLAEGYSMSQMSRRLHIPRATLYDQLDRVRRIFRDEGLSQFLDDSDT